MNVLFLNMHAGPPSINATRRTHQLCRRLNELGHRATIFCGSWSHLWHASPEAAASRGPVGFDGVDYVFVPTPPYRSSVSRVYATLAFSTRLARTYRGLVKSLEPDVIVAATAEQLDSYAAASLAKATGSRFVREIRDLWPLTLVELGGIPAHHPFVKFLDRTQRFAYRRADAVATTLRYTKDYMIERGLDSSRWHYLAQGIDVGATIANLRPMPDEHRKALEAIRGRGKFVVGYTGAFGKANALEGLLSAIELLPGDRFEFVFVGHGPNKGLLEEAAAKAADQNVHVLSPVAPDEVQNVLTMFDAGYIGYQPSPLYQYGISPNKMFNYLLAGLPVALAVTGRCHELDESGAGVMTQDASNPKAIAQLFHELDAAGRDARLEMGRRGQEYVKSHCDYGSLAAEYARILAG